MCCVGKSICSVIEAVKGFSNTRACSFFLDEKKARTRRAGLLSCLESGSRRDAIAFWLIPWSIQKVMSHPKSHESLDIFLVHNGAGRG